MYAIADGRVDELRDGFVDGLKDGWIMDAWKDVRMCLGMRA